jgi:arginine decarboxylase
VSRSDGQRVSVSIPDIIAGMQQRGLQMPVLLRIENLLDSQLTLLNETFARAISSLNYRGSYRGVFPIKVNQQCQVIEEIARFGAAYGHGLECGSKAELLIALASLDPDASHIVCNGYKDEEFITLALQSLKLGYRCIFVIETPAELPVILECSRRIGVKPILGLRVKLASKVGGYWNESSGDRSLFGLTTSQIVEVVDSLREHDMLDCLQLLHYHLGSQIPNIRDIRSGVLEACRYYVDLVKEGAALGYLDLGGGLAVDYDGTQTNYEYSKNYSLDEYCSDIVESIMTTLDPEGIAHPVIVTESGRATVAYSSVLLFNILDVTRFESGTLPQQIDPTEHELIRNLAEVLTSVSGKNLQECHNDAVYYRDEIRDLFKRGPDPPALAVAVGEAVPGDRAQHRSRIAERQAPAARPRGTRGLAVGHLLRQFLGVPVAARRVGDRAGVPGHAGTSPPSRSRHARPSSPTSPATPMARSTSSSARAGCRRRWRYIRCARASPTISACSWSGRTRKRWATCTT